MVSVLAAKELKDKLEVKKPLIENLSGSRACVDVPKSIFVIDFRYEIENNFDYFSHLYFSRNETLTGCVGLAFLMVRFWDFDAWIIDFYIQRVSESNL